LPEERRHVEIPANDPFHNRRQPFVVLNIEGTAFQYVVEKRHGRMIKNADIKWKRYATGQTLAEVQGVRRFLACFVVSRIDTNIHIVKRIGI
jgi:hypothetical protein